MLLRKSSEGNFVLLPVEAAAFMYRVVQKSATLVLICDNFRKLHRY